MIKNQNNLYAKLGLSSNATPKAIRYAYYALAKAYHPDGEPRDEVMEKAFAEISAAAAILRNPKMRSLYDRGYIDETGKRMDLRIRSEKRGRSQVIPPSMFALSFFTALLFAFWGLTGIREAGLERALQKGTDVRSGSVDQARIDVRDPHDAAVTSDRGGKPMSTKAASPLGLSNGTPMSQVPDAELSTEAIPAPSLADRSHLPGTESEKDLVYKSTASAEPLSPGKEEQQLPDIEEQRQRLREGNSPVVFKSSRNADLSAGDPVRGDIRSPRGPGRFRWQSSTLRTATCLSCLTLPNRNCAEVCP
jgi:curved DNA-binding protein CbpA